MIRERAQILVLVIAAFAIGFAANHLVFTPALAQATASPAPMMMSMGPGMGHGMMSPDQCMQMSGMMNMPMMHGTTGELMQTMMKTHHAMMQTTFTGNTDHDFVAMMVPHHQAALDSAQIELRSGKDPSIRNLAQRIIKSQQEDIDEMTAWLKNH